jgi:hypothetical protein
MAAQSGVFPIYLRAEYRGDGLRDFVRNAGQAAERAKREFEGVGEALDRALSRSRNQAGSLDLGVDEMRRAAEAQRQIAVAAREVAEATNRAATANGQFNASMAGATAAANALAASEEKAAREAMEQVQALEAVQRELNKTASATDLVTQAQRRGTNERGNVINGLRAERTAMIQFGQQLTDVTVQMEMGTRGMTIFTQQVPQMAFALSGLANNTNKTKAAIGSFATFLAGPWGAAIFAATALLGPYVLKLIQSADAARKAEFATYRFADAQSAIGSIIDLTTGKIKDQTDALVALARAQILAGQIEARRDQAESQKALRKIQNPGLDIGAALLGQLRERGGPEKTVVRAFLDGNATLDQTVDKLGELEKKGRITAETFIEVAEQVTKAGLAAANLAVFEKAERALDGDKSALEDFLKRLKSRKPGRTPRDTTVRDQATTDRFLEQSAERVFRINERFQQQGRLVQQSAQATRQLDNIIADVNRRLTLARNLTKAQREEFQKIVKEAEEAKGTIQEALLRPMQEAMLESQRRIQLQSLISQGRVDEAAALQATFQLEQEFGDEMFLRMELQKAIVGGKQDEIALADANLKRLLGEKALLFEILMIEQQQIRELQRKQALMEAQANVARTVADDLRSLLSGRSTDFFGNFQQALKDLQGARLFESLFGPAFQQLEQELAGNTPQGRANRAYIEETQRVTTATKSLSEAFVDLEDRVNSIMNGPTAANDNGPSAGFNPRLAMVMAALGPLGLPGITVTGGKPPPAEFAQKSIKDIAREISREAVKPGVELLSRLIGQEMAARVGEVVAGFIEGKARGGTVGGILGAGKGLIDGFKDEDGKLSKSLQGISDVLGKALDGAQTGSQVAGITAALGLPSNSTGAQIGGAIGSFIPIPGGSIIGAIAGNFLGALFAGIPKGSATVNGVGINSVVGNRGSLREAAGGLGGNVNDLISQIAKQLGGSISGSVAPVSIGIRDGDFRVDPTGRGTTRVAGGAIDFGEDQEAAVRYAAMLLIERGVIAGIKASEQRLLQAGKTLEDGLRDVLDFRSVFDRLKEFRDPLGFAIERLNREFERLIDLFNRAGASAQEFEDLRDLYDLERARAIEEVSNRVIGSLRSLLNELTIGNSGLSLRSRQQNALAQFDGLAARVAAGDASAFDDFADISKQLLDIERQLFGSTQSYFDRLAQITALTERAIADQTNITSIAASQPSPFPDRFELNRSIDIMNADVTGWLRAINDNLINLNPASRAGGGGSFDGGSSSFYDFGLLRDVSNF